MKNEWVALGFLVLGIFILNYSYLDSLLISAFDGYEDVIITRVIDGDTVAYELNGTEIKIRMLGINSPETGELYSDLAKNFLIENILNKRVRLYFGNEKTDRYGRTLAYVFLNGTNINSESVRLGFSNFYFPSGKDRFYNDFQEVWAECLFSQRNICEPSLNKCVGIKSIDVDLQRIILLNSCSRDFNLKGWSVKDEGRKKYVFGDFILRSGSEVSLIADDFGQDYVWTASGDSAFLRDSDGKLIDFYSY